MNIVFHIRKQSGRVLINLKISLNLKIGDENKIPHKIDEN